MVLETFWGLCRYQNPKYRWAWQGGSVVNVKQKQRCCHDRTTANRHGYIRFAFALFSVAHRVRVHFRFSYSAEQFSLIVVANGGDCDVSWPTDSGHVAWGRFPDEGRSRKIQSSVRYDYGRKCFLWRKCICFPYFWRFYCFVIFFNGLRHHCWNSAGQSRMLKQITRVIATFLCISKILVHQARSWVILYALLIFFLFASLSTHTTRRHNVPRGAQSRECYR